MKRCRSGLVAALAIAAAAPRGAQQKSPGAGPVIVLETVKGTIEFETYPEEAPKTVAQIVGAREEELLQRPAVPSRRAELPDPGRRSGDAQHDAAATGGDASGSGKPIGVAEITKKRRNVRGAVAMAYPGTDAKAADSQFYILRRAAPELDGEVHRVRPGASRGMDVVDEDPGGGRPQDGLS